MTERQRKPYEYENTFVVYRHEGDCNGKMQPGAVLRFAQQVATEQCNGYGITDEVYAKTHTAYVLAKQALHFERVPRVDETLTFITMPEALKRAVNKRLTSVMDAEGREVALVDSRWVLIDTEKRTILRKHPPEVCGPWAEELGRELPMRMRRPEEAAMESLGARQASWCQCDLNGHLNNTRYADIICDALPQQVLQAGEVTDLLMFYHREIPLGESYELRRGRLAENEWYVAGWREERCAFEAVVTFTNAEKGRA